MIHLLEFVSSFCSETPDDEAVIRIRIMDPLSFVTLDVFTSTRYTGNPLAVVHVPSDVLLSQEQKQRIAREFNLSESVFLHEQTAHDREDESVRLDIFTARAEVPFAGHPTVGTANFLLRMLSDDSNNDDALGRSRAGIKIKSAIKTLVLKAGRFGITLDPSGTSAQISVAHNVHIHADPFADHSFSVHGYPVVSIVKGMTFILARLPDVDALRVPSGNLLGADATYTSHEALDEDWRVGIVTTYFFVDLDQHKGDGKESSLPSSVKPSSHTDPNPGIRRLRTRMFGSREDPATGSAASALASYLSLQEGRVGTFSYHIMQGVEMGQRSEISVRVRVGLGTRVASSRAGAGDGDGDGGEIKDGASDVTEAVVGSGGGTGRGLEIQEVLLSGSAVLTMHGSLEIPEAEAD